MRTVAVAALACLGVALAEGAAAPGPVFRGAARPLAPAERAAMEGVSWRPGCPVGLEELRLLVVSHWGFDGRLHRGRLVVHASAARPLLAVFRRLFQARFPIRRMRPIEAYGGSDFRSIEADNTSAFNCRRATGSGRWSEHAYGRAVDVNPIENPYVEGGRVYHARSRPYLDRSRARPGMALPGGVLVRAFRAVGWGWGGDWKGRVRDYQHFSASGR